MEHHLWTKVWLTRVFVALRSCSGSHIVQSYSEARRAGVIPAEHALSGQRAPGFGHNRPHIREDGNSKPAAPCQPAHPNSQLCNQPLLEWVTFHLFGGSQWRWHLKNPWISVLGIWQIISLASLTLKWTKCIRKNTECFTSAVFGCAIGCFRNALFPKKISATQYVHLQGIYKPDPKYFFPSSTLEGPTT